MTWFTRKFVSTVRRASALLVLVAASGCQSDGSGAPDGSGPLRPSDSLLDDPALQAVVDFQVRRDAESLALMLGAEKEEVRARAALALASVQDISALPLLIAALAGDADANVRRDAAFAVGQLSDASAVEPLAAAFGAESDSQVRRRILEALGKIPVPQAAEALLAVDARSDEQVHRALALSVNGAVRGVVHPDAQDFLFSILDHADRDVGAAAAYFFGRSQDPSRWSARVGRIHEVLEGIGPGDPAAGYLVQALGKLGAAGDQEELARWVLEATDWRVRVEALNGIRPAAGDQAQLEVFLGALDDPSDHVAGIAAALIGRNAQVPSVVARLQTWVAANPDRLAVVGPLLSTLANQDAREFVYAWIDDGTGDDAERWRIGVEALAQLRGRDALDRLASGLNSASEDIVTATVVALADRWIDDQIYPELRPLYYTVLSEAMASGNPTAELAAGEVLADPLLHEFGSVARLIEAYQAGARGDDPRSAAELLRFVAITQVPQIEPVLRQAVDHPAYVVRRIAASGLQRLTGETIEISPDEDSAVEAEAASTLAYDPTVIDWKYVISLGTAPLWHITTNKGDVTLRLVTEQAPHTVQTIARLTDEGRFDGVPFHRVIPNFVAQGGDVDGGSGRGGPGYAITSEFTEIPYSRGAIGMASAGKDTEGSQFFIAHARLPHLDGGYTVFGWVESGMDVIDQIVQHDRIVSATLERSR